jgi:hypothetical protein
VAEAQERRTEYEKAGWKDIGKEYRYLGYKGGYKAVSLDKLDNGNEINERNKITKRRIRDWEITIKINWETVLVLIFLVIAFYFAS